MRIAKALSLYGVCSRRKAEELIEQGRVSINKSIINHPIYFVTRKDDIKVDGKTISTELEPVRIWKFFKPKGVITSTNDKQGRQTVFELLPNTLERVISIGRLDYNTEGLLLFTNRGEIARKFELPAYGYQRKYLCRSFGDIPDNIVKELARGINIKGIQYRQVKINIYNSKSHNNWSEITLFEGKNREIRKIFAYYGLQVSRLIRTSYGPYHLSNMQPRELQEVKHIT